MVRLPQAGRYRLSAKLAVKNGPVRLRVHFGPDSRRTWTVSATRDFQDIALAEPFDLPADVRILAVGHIPAGVRIDKLLLERRP